MMNVRVKFTTCILSQFRSECGNIRCVHLNLAVQGLWSRDDQVSPIGFLCSLIFLSLLNPTFSTGTTVTKPSAGIVILNYIQSKH